MNTETIVGRDLYVRRKSPSKTPIITRHRVWDADRFLASMQQQARDQAAKDGVEPDVITVASLEQYRAQ